MNRRRYEGERQGFSRFTRPPKGKLRRIARARRKARRAMRRRQRA